MEYHISMNLETLYTRHVKQAQALAYHLLRNPDDADDCVMDAVTRMVPIVDGLPDADARKVWLATVRNRAIDMLRLRRRIEDMTEYEIEETLNTDYVSASNLRESKGSVPPEGVDLIKWVKDACTPSEYGLVVAYLDCPEQTVLAARRGVTTDAISVALKRLGRKLGAARANIRAEIKLQMRLRESWGQGSRGGKSRRHIPRAAHLVSLLELVNLEGTLSATNTYKSPDGTGRWVTERNDWYGWNVALTPAKSELPYQGMLSCYCSC
jgi:hypothetical protein